jgi:hypothetical protein
MTVTALRTQLDYIGRILDMYEKTSETVLPETMHAIRGQLAIAHAEANNNLDWTTDALCTLRIQVEMRARFEEKQNEPAADCACSAATHAAIIITAALRNIRTLQNQETTK